MVDLLFPAYRNDERGTTPSVYRYREVDDDKVYEYQMSESFVPIRRKIRYISCREVQIRDLLEQLSFTRGNRNWGYSFRYGHFEIGREDFLPIVSAMLSNEQIECF